MHPLLSDAAYECELKNWRLCLEFLIFWGSTRGNGRARTSFQSEVFWSWMCLFPAFTVDGVLRGTCSFWHSFWFHLKLRTPPPVISAVFFLTTRLIGLKKWRLSVYRIKLFKYAIYSIAIAKSSIIIPQKIRQVWPSFFSSWALVLKVWAQLPV